MSSLLFLPPPSLIFSRQQRWWRQQHHCLQQQRLIQHASWPLSMDANLLLSRGKGMMRKMGDDEDEQLDDVDVEADRQCASPWARLRPARVAVCDSKAARDCGRAIARTASRSERNFPLRARISTRRCNAETHEAAYNSPSLPLAASPRSVCSSPLVGVGPSLSSCLSLLVPEDSLGHTISYHFRNCSRRCNRMILRKEGHSTKQCKEVEARQEEQWSAFVLAHA